MARKTGKIPPASAMPSCSCPSGPSQSAAPPTASSGPPCLPRSTGRRPPVSAEGRARQFRRDDRRVSRPATQQVGSGRLGSHRRPSAGPASRHVCSFTAHGLLKTMSIPTGNRRENRARRPWSDFCRLALPVLYLGNDSKGMKEPGSGQVNGLDQGKGCGGRKVLISGNLS